MFNLLRTFMAVYETRSFSLAAEQLFSSQPTVSHHIHQLEHELNVSLFERNKRSATIPTAAADILYEFSSNMLADWDKTKQAMQNTAATASVELNIGISQSVAVVLFPSLARGLKAAFPYLEFNVAVLNSLQVVKQMEARRLDLGFIEQPLTLKGAVRTTLCADQLVVAGWPTGTWLMREEGSGMRYYTTAYLQEAGITPDHLMTVNNNSMLRALVQNKVGQALLSDRIVPQEVPQQTIGAKFRRHFYLLQNPDVHWPHKQAMLDTIQHLANKVD
ncbi:MULTISPECIES: LysR family transcriptional regulator [Lacticaseibacillus]|uniref:LysR family transcriptional regulator n=2 Tax=Lacticaseibacillus TaxID=2759736 RepID=A0AAN1F0J8_LACCA|nr:MULTISPECIES: LysR family transcriptional regulator [Lacticaseibacillus]ARY92565.1 LysR family transcriptional regulator [Lacticaseibacillus casei]KAB1969594.1 LysR family transcriptional regulator [Lacticaseibacillus casei]WLV80466.1 LysR family transcriptional regulator [Lacticaseibacillus sp. NCIMB 15473]WNX24427.1 LysR family transcriptional regulator [Lacticaseibacillus casei]WNX27199.1 LysR family transcriptional regulator [Lacticaseibacillus casei]